ncbi:MAG: KpsF/GutQ family sugar-phosphate isomerase [Phycisphaeraceae bacterium]|nr:MAG: KpsF/GutQ family sugar-phosphate isomerase [Phycisphaeraceae bacterium]
MTMNEPNPVLHAEREYAKTVLRAEAEAISRAAAYLGPGFHDAVTIVEETIRKGGTVLVSGLGKSGLVGQKIAATMASLGIPAHAVHPTEAVHGDLGRFRKSDAVICISHSGETEEVVALASILRQDGIKVISITRGWVTGLTDPVGEAQPISSLERLSDAVLKELVTDEASADSNGDGIVAPTSSTTVTLALGDALALAVARRREFTDEDFKRRHPGGQLGGMLRSVTDLLRFRAGENLPLIEPTETVTQAIEHAATMPRRPGALLIVEPGTGRLAGIFTDGDLRRLVLRDRSELDRPIGEVMTASPRSLPDTALARDAVNLVREHRQDEIPVVDAQGRPMGLLDVQDLIAMRLVKD